MHQYNTNSQQNFKHSAVCSALSLVMIKGHTVLCALPCVQPYLLWLGESDIYHGVGPMPVELVDHIYLLLSTLNCATCNQGM